MKNEEKMLRAFSLVDDELVKNAAPKDQKPKMPLWRKKLAYVAVAACLLLAVILPLNLMDGNNGAVPVTLSGGITTEAPSSSTAPVTTRVSAGDTISPSATEPYPSAPMTTCSADTTAPHPLGPMPPLSDSTDQNAYYLLYEMLDSYLSESEIELPPSQATAPDIAPNGVTNDFSGSLTGADLIQKSDTHIFCLKDNKIEAYVPAGDSFECVGAFDVGEKSEFYLLDGGRKILLIGSSSLWTRLLLLDVSNPACMKELRRVRITGKLNSHALTEDGFVLATNYTVWEAPDYNNPTSFVPYIQYDGGEPSHLPMDNIIIPNGKLLGLNYAVIYSFDPNSLFLQSRAAVLGSGRTHIANSQVFVSIGYRAEYSEDLYTYTSKKVNDIYCFAHQNGVFAYRDTVTLDGSAVQNGMDIKDGVLRVITNEGRHTLIQKGNVNRSKTYTGASLYCLSLETLEVIASLKEFTPDGQTVRTVCFDGDLVYVCAEQSTSSSTPIFLLDLSDLSNITFVTPDEPYARSVSLSMFGKDLLLGIGYGHKELVGSPSPHKIEIFRKEGDKAVSIARYLVENDAEAIGHKSSSLDREYYIDIENRLVGFAVKTADENGKEKTEYLLLHFDGENLLEVARVEIGGDPCAVRTLLLDNKLYLFGEEAYQVITL